MIIGKIQAQNFSLFHDSKTLDKHGLKPTTKIEIVCGYNWEPCKDTIDVIKNMYCMDFFYPKENTDANKWQSNFGPINTFSTYPILIESFISFRQSDENQNN